MHILLVPSEYPTEDHKLGGIFIEEQKNYLKKYNKIGVLYIYLFSIKKLFSELIFKIGTIKKKKSFLIFYFPRVPYFRYINYLIHYYLFLKIFKIYIKNNGKPDLLHVHFSEFSIYTAYKIKKKYKIPYILTEHSTDFLDGRYEKRYNRKTELYKKIRLCFVETKKIICVSSVLKKKLTKYYNLNKNKLVVIPNLSKTLNLKKNPKKNTDIIFVGTLDNRKNPFLLLKAFKKIYKNKLKLIFIGDGFLKNKMINFIKKNNLKNYVKIYSSLRRESVLKLISKSKILASTSFYETFGIVIIEAYSMGIPVIMTDSLGNRDLYNKYCSIKVKNFDVDSFANSIDKMLNNYKNYKKNKIINFYKKNFSPNQVVNKINLLYRIK